MDPEITNAIAKTIARKIEWAAEIARIHGFRFPKQYQFGLSMDDAWTKGGKRRLDLTLRIEDTRVKKRLLAPYEMSQSELERFQKGIAQAALEVTGSYIEDHEELVEDAEAVAKILKEIDATNPEEIDKKAKKAARTATYKSAS